MLLCFKGVGMAQLVEHLTEKPGEILTWIQVPGVVRDFLPASTSSSSANSYAVLLCPYDTVI